MYKIHLPLRNNSSKTPIIMTKKLDIVDFLRGFSITTIVLMHLLQSYNLPGFLMKATSFGGAGVHVFILCSGFGLYLSHLNKPLGYKDFLKRRFGRIYWPMAVVCIVTALWMIYQGRDVLMPLLGNLFLFKMFVPELESSMGGQMWFISTIIQFYIAYPLIIRLIHKSGGVKTAFVISVLWASIVGLLGYGEERIWNSFFLQYLWEFCLGMKFAEIYVRNPERLNIPKWKYLIPICILGMSLTSIMGWLGFPWKLYNDIPSLFGYTSLALMVYKVGINSVNRFFSYTNRFSYEWYLVHILVFQIVRHCSSCDGNNILIIAEIFSCLLISYFVAMGYARIWKKQ